LPGVCLTDQRRSLVERIAGLYGAGAMAMLLGEFWSWIFPINKNLWTSSYVVFTAGFASIVLATCLWRIELHGLRRWTKPFVIYGVNPLAAFVGSGIMTRCIDSLFKVTLDGERVSLHSASFDLWFAPFFDARFASLLWGLCFVA